MLRMASDEGVAARRLPGEVDDAAEVIRPSPPAVDTTSPTTPQESVRYLRTPPQSTESGGVSLQFSTPQAATQSGAEAAVTWCPPAEFVAGLEALLEEKHQELLAHLRTLAWSEVGDAVKPQARDNSVFTQDGPSARVSAGTAGCSALRVSAETPEVVREASCCIQNGPSAPAIVAARTTDGLTRRATWALARRARSVKPDDHRAKLLRITSHWAYELANAILISINALLIAWETQYSAQQVQAGEPRDAIQFVIVMYLFCTIFSIDLALRMVAQGLLFFYSMDWKWNWFDFVVVFSSVMEASNNEFWMSNAQVLRVARLMRLFRVARIGRALRSFNYFREFRLTVTALCDAIRPLVTFSTIMAMILMVFAIFFTDGATGYLGSYGQEEELVRYYGSLAITMATLFKAISGGVDWENAAEPLKKLSALYTFIFYCYMVFSVVAMLNVISAMFIDSILQRSKNDRDFIVQTEIKEKTDFMGTMEHLFEELDPNRSGTICLKEFQAHIRDPQVNAYFHAIDLPTYKVNELFQLLDINKSGGIDRAEFIQGCTRLRGEAKELDVAIIQYRMRSMAQDTNAIKNLVVELAQKIDQSFARPSKRASDQRSAATHS